MNKKKLFLIILFSFFWGGVTHVVLRNMLGLPYIFSLLVGTIGVGVFFAWITGELSKGKSALKEFEEHEERIKISKMYDESVKKNSD